MTDTLKTVIVNAFTEANLRPDFGSMELVGRPVFGAQNVLGTRTSSCGYLGHAFDLDIVATAIRDHLFDRDKVRAALLNACANEGVICGDGPDEPLIIERTIDDEFLDRLIEGLSK